MKRHAFALLLLCALVGCTTAKESEPARTATEQMLISSAADRAADKLAMAIPPRTAVFIDATNFEGTDSKYALGAIRAHLVKQGAKLVDDKKQAKTVVELRSGALSIDKSETFVGIPSYSIPIPLSSGSLTTPEIALYKDAVQKGVAKFAAIAYDAKQGGNVTIQDPQYGFAHKAQKTVLIFVSWTDDDALPDEDKDAETHLTDKVSVNGKSSQ
jgi:hypothetical protein